MKKGVDRLKKIQSLYIKVDLHKCKACWKCIEVCPKQVIGKVGFLWHKHIVLKESDNCTGCQICIKTCPYEVFSSK